MAADEAVLLLRLRGLLRRCHMLRPLCLARHQPLRREWRRRRPRREWLRHRREWLRHMSLHHNGRIWPRHHRIWPRHAVRRRTSQRPVAACLAPMAAGNASRARPRRIAQLRRSEENGDVRKLDEWNDRDRLMGRGLVTRMPASSTGRAAKLAATRREPTASSTETRRLARGRLSPVSKRVNPSNHVSRNNRVGKI